MFLHNLDLLSRWNAHPMAAEPGGSPYAVQEKSNQKRCPMNNNFAQLYILTQLGSLAEMECPPMAAALGVSHHAGQEISKMTMLTVDAYPASSLSYRRTSVGRTGLHR